MGGNIKMYYPYSSLLCTTGSQSCVTIAVISWCNATNLSKLILSVQWSPVWLGVMRVKNITSQPEGLCSWFIIHVAYPTHHPI